MSATTAITTKGQITLPKAIRDKLGVKPGDRVTFREQSDGKIVVEAATVDLLSLCGIVKPNVRGVSVEDMNDAIGQGVVGRFKRSPGKSR
ncbi:MAG: AbrB/MazE/SpoVT family DNA-binding domain-containing protein [Polyangiaceae bacterium]